MAGTLAKGHVFEKEFMFSLLDYVHWIISMDGENYAQVILNHADKTAVCIYSTTRGQQQRGSLGYSYKAWCRALNEMPELMHRVDCHCSSVP